MEKPIPSSLNKLAYDAMIYFFPKCNIHLLAKDVLQLVFLYLCSIELRWHKNNVLHCEIPYVDGVKHGIERYWYTNGQLKYKNPYVCIGNLKNKENGKLHSIREAWYDNGQLWYKYPLVHGEIHGICREWHLNGKLSKEILYKNGNKHGTEKHWYDNGYLKYEISNINGKLCKQREWNRNRKIVRRKYK